MKPEIPVSGVQSWLTLIFNEIPQGAVIGAFSGGAEEAAGNLSLFPMVKNALAAVAPLVAGSVGTGAVFDSSGRDAFHYVDSPLMVEFSELFPKRRLLNLIAGSWKNLQIDDQQKVIITVAVIQYI